MDLEKLGGRIQALRRERGLTLQSLAVAASVSVSMLSSVERGQKAPTIVVLDRIARGLDVQLTQLVATADQNRVIVRRAGDQDNIDEPGGWRRAILSPVVPGVNFELIRATLPPYCEAGEFPAYAPNSHEYIAVESGMLRLVIGEDVFDLDAGDSIYFAADVVHRYANAASSPCTYYIAALIMRPRGGRPDEPVVLR
jgi:XRE family transcriptional regulator, regulator of sulfur utilization